MTRASQRFLPRVRRSAAERFMRFLFFVLRRVQPVFRVPGWRIVPRPLRHTVWVTRYADVKHVLKHEQAYSVRRFGSRMRETGPDFFLGYDAGPQRDRDRDASIAALEELSSRRVFEIARKATLEVITPRIETARGMPDRDPGTDPCELDIIAELGNVVPVRVAEEIFGLENPGEKRLLKWIQLTSWYIFNPAASDADRDRAVRAGREMEDHLSRLVDARLRQCHPGGTVLDLLLRAGMSKAEVMRNVAGLAAGTLGPPPRLWANAADRLLGLPGRRLRRLRKVASAGDVQEIEAYLLEAGRLAPDPAFIYRTCELPKMTVIGRPIEAGSTVVCAVGSALRDSRPIRRPRRFALGRPDAHLMLFGKGTHECIGRDIGMAMLTGMAQPLFALPGIARAPGGAGCLAPGAWRTYPAQNYPAHLVVHFRTPSEGSWPGSVSDEADHPDASA